MLMKLPMLLIACILMGDTQSAYSHPDATIDTGAVRATLLQDTSAPRSQTSLLLKIRNAGEKPIALALGVELDGGYAGIKLKALSLEIVDSHGVSSTWEPSDFGVGSGRPPDPFLILLVPRAEITLPLSLSQMMASQNPGIQVLPKGPITVKAKLTCSVPKVDHLSWDIRGIATMPFWTGVTYSNPLRLS